MASIDKYRQKWLKYHTSYERRAYRELRKTFKKWNDTIVNTEFKEGDIKSQLSLLVNFEDLYSTYFAIYYGIGLTHGQRVGNDINIGLKEFTLANFMQLFENELPTFLRQYGITRIQLVHSTYLEKVFELFNSRLLAGQTLKQTTDEVYQIMRSPRFYRWEAERIARTETTGAANYAATKAGKVSGYIMEKEWISAVDARTRRQPESNFDHYHMNGKRVGLNDEFIFNPKSLYSDSLAYPGDPKGQAGNVINCRCTVAVVPKRDKDGRLIRV